MGEQRAPLVFVDLESTGLQAYDEPWEVALIRRDPDGTEVTLHAFIRHDTTLAERLPESFRRDYVARYDADTAVWPWQFAGAIPVLLQVPEDTPYDLHPHLVGVNPRFDEQHLQRLLLSLPVPVKAPWHHHLVDVLPLAVGALVGAWDTEETFCGGRPMRPRPDGPPWSSSEVSRQVGVDPDRFRRHTALGDARWAAAIYDAVMGGVA